MRPASPLRSVLAVALVAAVAVGCGDRSAAPAPGEGPVVARIGDATLTTGDLGDAIAGATGPDSVRAVELAAAQWTRRELLVQEARRQGLDRDPVVRRRVAEAERAALEAAAIEALFVSASAEPSEAELDAYYQAHREALALREPYVRLRHLRLADPTRVDEAQASVARAVTSSVPDSLFALAAREYALDPVRAAAFAAEYVPEGRLRALDETLGDRVSAMPPGPAVAVVQTGGAIHLVQVVDREPAGTIPPFRLIRAELAERLAVQARRDAHSRLIQRLRSEARARGDLDG
ncbi:peptidyl-prolyl cis-trans isomerase [Rubrivirga sp. IMCC43871]|uniref:peptidylprolyl isomerase n=1 Tax=Rubrivirga sp. IMCC43871 TaxID=3391575 RepID=UPI0039901ECF